MKAKEVKIDLATLRAFAAIQPTGRAELARAAGVALPNLSRYLKSGQETLISKVLRDRLFKEMGLSASGWLKAGCHVWRSENVEDIIKACQWVVPEAVRVSISEVRSEDVQLDTSEALVQVYLLKWLIDKRPRRVLLQLRVTEQQATEARNRLIECGLFSVDRNDEIPVLPLATEEFETLSEIKDMSGREFDDLYDRDSEVTWDAIFSMLPGLFGSAGEAYETLQVLAASREIGRAKRRVRGVKSK